MKTFASSRTWILPSRTPTRSPSFRPSPEADSLNADQVARYARQIALPEVGPEGQAAICGARVLIVGGDLAAETARTYLAAAGVGAVEMRTRVGDGAAWLDALAGVDLVVRTDF